MRFGRTIFILFIVTGLLAGALVTTRWIRPQHTWYKGDRLIPVAPETIYELSWEVANAKGEWTKMTVQREGEFWRLKSPYAGALCDATMVYTCLDAIQSMRVVAQLDETQEDAFQAERHLTVKTADATYTCAISSLSPMALAQALVKINDAVVSVDAEAISKLPETANAMLTRAVLPVSENRLLTLEWRSPGHSFARALRMRNGNWKITRPFEFEAQSSETRAALEHLTDTTIISDYILPAPGQDAVLLSSEVELARFGLDEENAVRVSAYARGLTDAILLRFGKADPQRKGNVFCLLDGYQAVVSVPKTLRDIFEDNGPFATDFHDLPVIGETARTIEQMTIDDASATPAIKLAHATHGWSLVSPMNLPADDARVQALLDTFAKLTGDLIGSDPPETFTQLCDVTLLPKGKEANEITLSLYKLSDTEYHVYRYDQSRLYRVKASALPKGLLEEKFEHTLIDRTVLSLPAASIHRISVTHRDQRVETIVRNEARGLGVWDTESPRGAYVNTSVVDAWLTHFADMKAVRVLRDMPTAYGALRSYGLDQPRLTLTLDLKGGDAGLRRVLLIGNPDAKTGAVPAVVQGRPILYELDAKLFKLLLESPVQFENPKE